MGIMVTLWLMRSYSGVCGDVLDMIILVMGLFFSKRINYEKLKKHRER